MTGHGGSRQTGRPWVRTEGTRGHDVGGTERGGPRRILWARASRRAGGRWRADMTPYLQWWIRGAAGKLLRACGTQAV